MPEGGQLGHALVDLHHLAAEDGPHVAARLLATVAQGEDLAHLVEGQAETLRRLDEREALDVGLPVVPIARGRPVGSGSRPMPS